MKTQTLLIVIGVGVGMWWLAKQNQPPPAPPPAINPSGGSPSGGGGSVFDRILALADDISKDVGYFAQSAPKNT